LSDEKSKHLHRAVILSETHLFVLDFSKAEAKKDIWKGEGAHLPIPFKKILQINPMTKYSEIFAVSIYILDSFSMGVKYVYTQEDTINKHVRHFELVYKVTKGGKSSKQYIELAAWEENSILLKQIQATWNNMVVRLCLNLDIAIAFDASASKEVILELFNEIENDILSRSKADMQECVKLINELGSAGLHDRELKSIFFSRPEFIQHLLSELGLNSMPTKSFSRTEQLQYCYSILKLFHCMIFNSQTVLKRSNILSPTPFSFCDFLERICFMFTDSSVRKLATRREKQLKMIEQGNHSESDGEYDSDDSEHIESSEDQNNALIESINETQVAILIEMDDVMAFAICQGGSRMLVSETLAAQLYRSDIDFTKTCLVQYVRNLVSLLMKWENCHDAAAKIPALAVRIFQHIKLIHNLVLGSYRMLEDMLEFSEEELRYYLLKDSFTETLNRVPKRAHSFVQVTILNRLSKTLLNEIKSAIYQLEEQRSTEKLQKSVLLV